MSGETLAVIGLGYVGLPLVLEAVSRGIPCVGFDTSQRVLDSLAVGRSHVDDIPDSAIVQMLEHGLLLTSESERLGDADVVVICVPTPLSSDGGPDLTAVEAAARTIASVIRPGQLIVLESTTYPGTTEEVLVPILEESGLKAGLDFNCAFSPERIDPGNLKFGLRNTPKVVGGLTSACLDRAAAFYGQLVDEVIRARGVREAEMTKLLENTYRHVNIALVNEMARFCHELDIDLWDAIRCASSKPFGFQAFYPGPGVGGHCIPIDPNYLSHRVRTHLGQPFRFVELAQEINSGMPTYVVRRAQDALNSKGKAVKGSRITLVGITYKADISDQRESPAVAVAVALRALGAQIEYVDPYVPMWRVGEEAVARRDDLETVAEEVDLVILLQPHRSLAIDSLVGRTATVLDTRGVLHGSNIETL